MSKDTVQHFHNGDTFWWIPNNLDIGVVKVKYLEDDTFSEAKPSQKAGLKTLYIKSDAFGHGYAYPTNLYRSKDAAEKALLLLRTINEIYAMDHAAAQKEIENADV